MPRVDQLAVTLLDVVPRRPDGTVDVLAVADALAPAVLLAMLEGAGWTYVVPSTSRRFVDDGTRAVLIDADGVHELGTDPFAALDGLCERLGLHPSAGADDDLPPFSGGLVGAFVYELSRRIETLGARARRDRGHDDIWLMLAEDVVAIDPAGETARLVHRELPTGARKEPIAPIRERLRHATPFAPSPRAVGGTARSSLSREAYLAAVATILEHIAAGEVFQVNLTQRLTAAWDDSPLALYAALSQASPAPMGACLPELGIASISPETFLSVDGGTITTRPIKGTRPRHRDPHLDAALADDLATSAKDRAENIMVVDMERNDLGRICVPGSIHVPRLLDVESHPTVWHLVSSVVGKLRAETGYGAMLRATFPCGSVTGAPKVAAMQIIDRREPVTRGWYCGAIGFLSAGQASLSVGIRTATVQPDGQVDYGAGGGIVADSDPQAEFAECQDKAAAFFAAVGARP
ncbi:MAG: aminodeoxychorismate synthase component I [Nitriliruptoraceae bacterium]